MTISAHHVHHICGQVFLRPSKFACAFIIFHYFLVELVTDKSVVAFAMTSCFCLSSVISTDSTQYLKKMGLWSYWDLNETYKADSEILRP